MHKKQEKQSIISIIILILLFISILSGCTDPAPVRPEIQDFFSITDTQIQQSKTQAENWILSSKETTGLITETYQPETNTSFIEPDILLQLQTASLIASNANDNSDYEQLHHDQITYILTNWYHTENQTIYIGKQNNTDQIHHIADLLNILLNSPNKDNYSTEIDVLATTLYTYYLERIKDPYNTILSNEEVKQLSSSLQTMINYNQQHATPLFNQSYIEQLTHDALQYLDVLSNTSMIYELIPWITTSHYQQTIYLQTNDTLEEIFALNQQLLPLQETENKINRGSFSHSGYLHKPNTIYDALFTKSIAQAYHLAIITNNTTMINTFQKPLFLGINYLLSLQYNQSDNPKAHGGISQQKNDTTIGLQPTLYTIQTLDQISHIYENTTWQYIYSGTQGILHLDTIIEDEYAVWYSLIYGVILSSIALFILYFILQLIRKRKK